MIINWDLLKHPLNWLIVILMLVIAGTAGDFALRYFGAQAASPSSGPTQTGNLTEYQTAVPDRNQIALSALG
jgi:hypothetical protein